MAKYRGKQPSRAERDAAEARLLDQQIDLEEDIALSAQEAARASNSGGRPSDPSKVYNVVPDPCPGCGVGMGTGQWVWTHMGLFTPTVERPNFEHKIQCGRCAFIAWTTEQVWTEVQSENRRRFPGHARVKIAKEKPYSERGME